MTKIPYRFIHSGNVWMQQIQDSIRTALDFVGKNMPDSGANVPVGGMIFWDETTLTGTPELPDGWKLCDGTRLVDSDSPFHGQTLPSESGKIIRVR